MMKAGYIFSFLRRLKNKYSFSRIKGQYIYRLNEENKRIKFYEDLEKFELSKSTAAENNTMETVRLIPFLNDKTEFTYFDAHYTYHPAWAARVLSKTQPDFHVDISSTVNFCSIVSAFIPVHFYDYRPANIKLSSLTIGKADLLSLPFPESSVHSISCMHTVEHIGLGRYGDPIDFGGDRKAMAELQRVLAIGGALLFVVPVGARRIEFNAHRIYNFEDIINTFNQLKLIEFSLIPDNYEEQGMMINPGSALVNSQDWGCGCFWFTKE